MLGFDAIIVEGLHHNQKGHTKMEVFNGEKVTSAQLRLIAHVFASALSQRTIDTMEKELAGIRKAGNRPKPNS